MRLAYTTRFGTQRDASIVDWKVTSEGYIVVGLITEQKRYVLRVANLLAKTFIDNPRCDFCVRYVDDNPLNISLDNIEWCSPQQIALKEKALLARALRSTLAVLTDAELGLPEALTEAKAQASSQGDLVRLVLEKTDQLNRRMTA